MDKQLWIIWARYYFGIPIIRLSINNSVTDHAMRWLISVKKLNEIYVIERYFVLFIFKGEMFPI